MSLSTSTAWNPVDVRTEVGVSCPALQAFTRIDRQQDASRLPLAPAFLMHR
ncbi:hypothetical protein GA0115244_114317 [Streptomyces sp. DvalAA-19]|nr:hypothetical protein GA0115244_114317 [Streptomyces sp. DvalAA-19]